MRRLMVLMVACAAIAQANPVAAARCKKAFVAGSSSQYIGQAGWQDQAQQTIVGSTEDRTVGRTVMTCTVKLATRTASLVLDFEGARVSFTGPDSAGGLEISAFGGKPDSGAPAACTISGLRVSRENWIELGPGRYDLRFPSPVDRVTLIFSLVDSSTAAAVRADINPVTVRPRRDGESTLQCPPAVR